jgi:hypothetical protein
MGGKEFNLPNNAILQAGTKIILNGGGRITPLIAGMTGDGQTPPWDWTQPFNEAVSTYFRPDIRVAYRKNNPKSAWILSLDVQNIIARQNEDNIDRVYDPDTQNWINRNQSALTPVLSFQIDW